MVVCIKEVDVVLYVVLFGGLSLLGLLLMKVYFVLLKFVVNLWLNWLGVVKDMCYVLLLI